MVPQIPSKKSSVRTESLKQLLTAVIQQGVHLMFDALNYALQSVGLIILSGFGPNQAVNRRPI